MITQILFFILGIISGLGIAWYLGGKGIENLQDWLYYGKGKKYLDK